MRLQLVALLVFLIAPSSLFAQKTEADLRARLVKKPLYLSGQWRADKLTFDNTGHLSEAIGPVPFTLSGIEISSIKLTPKELVLDGQRVGLEFKKDVPQRVGLVVRSGWGAASPEKMTIRIEAPADGDYTAALDSIFIDDLADMVPRMPSYWRKFADKYLLPQQSPMRVPDAAVGNGTAPDTSSGAQLKKIGGSVTAPRLLTHVDPSFDDAARALRYSGITLVNLIVDTEGKPQQVQVVHPVGLGLDEAAIAAVSRYTFQAAMENGNPVPVELNVEVNFQIF